LLPLHVLDRCDLSGSRREDRDEEPLNCMAIELIRAKSDHSTK